MASEQPRQESGDGPKTIRVFAAASFLNDLGSDIIYPIWPLFVTGILKANMAALGFLDGLGDALVSLSQAGSGYLSDRLKRRKMFIWAGYLLGALSRVGYALSSLWPHLIPFRVMDRVGKIRSAPRDAFVADVSSDTDRGKNFGLLRAMDNLGAVCGILVCIALFGILGYRTLFILAAVPSFISAFLIVSFIREKTPSRRLYIGPRFSDLSPNFKLFLILSACFALGSFSYSFLLVFANRSGFKTTFVPVLYLLMAASASLFSFPFGKLSDRIGRKPIIMLSFLLWAGVCGIFLTSPEKIWIAASFLLYGAHKGALEPVQKTWVSELAPCDFRASCLGGFQMIIGLSSLPASLIAGILWEVFGMEAPFLFSLGLAFVASGLLVFVKQR
ncbi:MAG: MFS transporter [Candidatus Aminicenantales bacterium]